jgi:hypothetical protein
MNCDIGAGMELWQDIVLPKGKSKSTPPPVFEGGEDCCEHFPNTTPGYAIRARWGRKDRRGHYLERIMQVQRTTACGGDSEPGFMQVTML